MEKLSLQIQIFAKTLFFFLLACIVAPFLLISYLCVQIANKTFLKFLSLKYPQYEFSRTKKIRTLIETTRNPGIFSYLLKVNGICDFEKIREHYNTHLIEKCNKSGELRFAKLRRKLISCWGHYAWVKDDSEFRPEQHIILSPSTYKRRPITEQNIQNYVSDIVSKHIAFDTPQWQVVVIPTSPSQVIEVDSSTTESSPESPIESNPQNESDYYYVLVRVHHLILAEEKDFQPNDMLLIKPSSKAVDIFEPPANGSTNLINIVKKPKHIPNLWTHITMTASNRWNEFIYHYDPLESPDVDKKQPINCCTHLISILFITTFTVCSDFIREYDKIKNHPQYKIKFLLNLIKRESHKRNLNRNAFIDSILFSFNPINILKFMVAMFLKIMFTIILLSPYYLYREFLAAGDILTMGRTKLTNTLISILAVYLPLFYYAIIELNDIICEVVKAPRFVYEEFFESPTREANVLQVKSYRGRRVVSFSKSIDMNVLRERITTIDEYAESEYMYACLAAALIPFLKGYDAFDTPAMMNVTSRSFEKGYFLTKDDMYNHISGVVFHQLPLAEPSLNQLKAIREIMDRVRRKQIAIYLVSMGQTKSDFITNILPEVILKILINYFSINFPITITEIHGDFTNVQTVWGQTLQDLICFRPQQSKTCLSLNLHITGRTCRLAVMADSQLAPHHTKISEAWAYYMENTII